jgi:hypothetical protein
MSSPIVIHSCLLVFYLYAEIWPNFFLTLVVYDAAVERRNPLLFQSNTQRQPTYPLHPIKTNNARTLRITAAAGTKLAGASYCDYRQCPHRWKHFTENYAPSSCMCSHWVKLSLIAQYSPLLPPVRARTLSQFRCGWSISKINYASLSREAITLPTNTDPPTVHYRAIKSFWY